MPADAIDNQVKILDGHHTLLASLRLTWTEEALIAAAIGVLDTYFRELQRMRRHRYIADRLMNYCAHKTRRLPG